MSANLINIVVSKFNKHSCLDKIEYRWLMSSSLYRRVTDEIENGNLAMVLATNIQYIGFKGLRQVYLYFVQMYGGLFTNIADRLVES